MWRGLTVIVSPYFKGGALMVSPYLKGESPSDEQASHSTHAHWGVGPALSAAALPPPHITVADNSQVNHAITFCFPFQDQ